MSDHFSGPRALADPVLDLTDLFAFPSPERPGNLVLAMNVFPLATVSALFSDAIDYRFRLRPVQLGSPGDGAGFVVGEAEHFLSFTFGAPRKLDGSEQLVQEGTCTAPTGEAIAFRVGDERGAQSKGLRVFTGCRLDPFFLDLRVPQEIKRTRRLPPAAPGESTLAGQNVLSIVVEAEPSALTGIGSGSLFAVVAEATTIGSLRVRLERVGRPEMKNVILKEKDSDPVNRDLEIRDLYNEEDPFKLGNDYIGAYRARFNSNLAFYDAVDGKTDWPPDEQGNHPLTDLLLADFLVVDVSKPYAEDSYFEIERALLSGVAHETCGGRSLNDDIIDTLLTLLINNGNGPRVSDGVHQATVPGSRAFPYLARPNPNPPPLAALTTPR